MLTHLTQSDIDAVIAACGPGENDANDNGQNDDRQDAVGRERVYSLVENLSLGAQEELLALMWTGGPKNEISFAENLELVRKTRDENHASHIAEQHARLPLYLRDGLEKLSAEKA